MSILLVYPRNHKRSCLEVREPIHLRDFIDLTIDSRKHVLSDLRPYVCTFENCDIKLFSNRQDWFDHEVQCHRSRWGCQFCSHTPFLTLDSFQAHFKKSHGKGFSQDQIEAVCQASQFSVDHMEALDCPFCLDWDAQLRSLNPHVTADEKIVVTPNQFRRHVGGHMQQLALFAISRAHLEQEEGEGDSVGTAAAVATGINNSELQKELSDEGKSSDVVLAFLQDYPKKSHPETHQQDVWWTCSSCSASNDASLQSCVICEQSRPTEFEIKSDGDFRASKTSLEEGNEITGEILSLLNDTQDLILPQKFLSVLETGINMILDRSVRMERYSNSLVLNCFRRFFDELEHQNFDRMKYRSLRYILILFHSISMDVLKHAGSGEYLTIKISPYDCICLLLEFIADIVALGRFDGFLMNDTASHIHRQKELSWEKAYDFLKDMERRLLPTPSIHSPSPLYSQCLRCLTLFVKFYEFCSTCGSRIWTSEEEILHQLATGPKSFHKLSESLSSGFVLFHLRSPDIINVDGRFTLTDQAYRRLDCINFPFKSTQDRISAIENRREAFGRLGIPTDYPSSLGDSAKQMKFRTPMTRTEESFMPMKLATTSRMLKTTM